MKSVNDFIRGINNPIHPYATIINIELYDREWVGKIHGGLKEIEGRWTTALRRRANFAGTRDE
jgi:hypothetical protein